jgi:RNA polymerase sigma-70 factor (ECF subfamily)
VNLDPSRSTTTKDKEVATLYLRGEREAVDTIGRWIQSALGRRFLFSSQDREDIVQVVHTKLLANLRDGNFRHDSSLATYVARIARYTAIDRLRRSRRDRMTGITGDFPVEHDPSARLETMERVERVHAALQQSSPECLALWKLIFIDRLSYKDIAGKMDIPEGTVKSRAWNCRKRLQEAYDSLDRRGNHVR